MASEAPLVSVIVPTYNRAGLLGRALESVRAQDYPRVEVIVVDDASDDDTFSVVARARLRLKERGVTLISHKLRTNAGAGAARNAGLDLATGELIACLDSDDAWRPSFLTTVVELLERNPDCGVAFSGHLGIDIQDNIVARVAPDLLGRQGLLSKPFELFTSSFPFITSGTVVRRTVLDSVGYFDESLVAWQDADLWLRIAKRFDFAYTSERLSCYRLHEGNKTNRRVEWFAHQLRVRLRHVADIRDIAMRRVAVAEIRRAQVLLQEQLLRDGISVDEFLAVLRTEHSPRTPRYLLGQLVTGAPEWVQRVFAWLVRGCGNARRWVVRTVRRLSGRTMPDLSGHRRRALPAVFAPGGRRSAVMAGALGFAGFLARLANLFDVSGS